MLAVTSTDETESIFFLFTNALFNDTVISSDYIVPNDRMTDE